MTLIRHLFGSSIGLKYVMAVTGLLLVVYVVGHMLGNLLIFVGRDALNAYAETLQSSTMLLWTARVVLLAVFVVHIGCGAKLAMSNRDARPIRYAHNDTVQASVASRTMIWTGLVVLVFVAYHLAHFTLHLVHYDGSFVDAQGRHDVYRMVVESFRMPLVSGLYIAAQVVLWFHLTHGIGSLFQSLGLRSSRSQRLIRNAGRAIAAAVLIGNVAMPVAALTGLLEASP